MSVDLATFTRLMTSKAVADYLSPDRALLPTFEAIDLNGDGKISQVTLTLTLTLTLTSTETARSRRYVQVGVRVRRGLGLG